MPVKYSWNCTHLNLNTFLEIIYPKIFREADSFPFFTFFRFFLHSIPKQSIFANQEILMINFHLNEKQNLG